jgi:hypothetical protein
MTDTTSSLIDEIALELSNSDALAGVTAMVHSSHYINRAKRLLTIMEDASTRKEAAPIIDGVDIFGRDVRPDTLNDCLQEAIEALVDNGTHPADVMLVKFRKAMQAALIEQQSCEISVKDTPDRLIMACEEVLRLMGKWAKGYGFGPNCDHAINALHREMQNHLASPKREQGEILDNKVDLVPLLLALYVHKPIFNQETPRGLSEEFINRLFAVFQAAGISETGYPESDGTWKNH